MMKNPIGFGIVAITATASLAWAGGDEEKKAGGLDRLNNAQGGGPGEPSKVTFSAAAGKGITIDAGDSFMMNIKNRIQPYYSFVANDDENPSSNGSYPDVSSFSMRRARTRFAGHVWSKDITFMLQNDWVEGTSIKDAWIHWFFYREEGHKIGLRFGQTKTFFGREATGTSGGLEFVDRSLASRVFSNRRQRGAVVTGEHSEGKLHWTAGVFNGETAGAGAGLDGASEEGGNSDNEMTSIFSVRIDPNGDMGDEGYTQGDLSSPHKDELLYSIGAGLQLGNNRTSATGPDIEANQVNINAGVKCSGIHVSLDAFLRKDDPDQAVASDSIGWHAGGTYTLEKQDGAHSQWAVGGRFSQIKFDDPVVLLTGPANPLGGSLGDVKELTVVLNNYYHEHNLKTQVSWTRQWIDPTGAASAKNDIIELQLTMVF